MVICSDGWRKLYRRCLVCRKHLAELCYWRSEFLLHAHTGHSGSKGMAPPVSHGISRKTAPESFSICAKMQVNPIPTVLRQSLVLILSIKLKNCASRCMVICTYRNAWIINRPPLTVTARKWGLIQLHLVNQ